MRDATLECPHCDENIEIFHCDKCKGVAVRNEGAETCTECEGDFCEEHLDDHDCEGQDDEDEPDESDVDEG